MPTSLSAKKRQRQNEKRKERNLKRKKKLKSTVREIETLIEEGKKEQAEELIPRLMKAADRASAKGPFHQNKTDRIKSKIISRINEL